MPAAARGRSSGTNGPFDSARASPQTAGPARKPMSATIYFDSEPETGFDERCARSASALRELGVGPGDVVALMLQNEPILLELMLAARQVGAYFCLVNWHFKSGEVAHILSDSGARVLVVHAHLVDTIREGLPP